MQSFDIIVAVDSKLGIGKNGSIPWHLSGDLKHFKEITCASSPSKENVVIMGRKTWEDLPAHFRPLPNRINIVLTKNQNIDLPEGVLKAQSFDQALTLLNSKEMKSRIGSIFIIGGGEVFKEAIRNPNCSKIHMTHILANFNCDTFFPPFMSQYRLESKSSPLIDKSLEYYFSVYIRL